MKIRTTNETLFGSNTIVPIDGQISVDKEGFAEVSSAAGEVLINGNSEWASAEEEEVEEEVDNSVLAASIAEASLDQLVQLAKDTKVKGWQAFKADEEKLRQFLLKKLNLLQDGGTDA